ncbi:MAG: sensor domain-containing diguanylate cyclase [Thiolinea sp.]
MNNNSIDRELLLATVEAAPVGMLLADRHSKVLFTNQTLRLTFGYAEHELEGQTLDCLIPEAAGVHHARKVSDYFSHLESRAMSRGRLLRGRKKDGSTVQVEIGLNPVQIKGDTCVLASVLDAAGKVLNVAGFADPLTGLANRSLFLDLGNKLRSLAMHEHTSLALIFIDLDGFKSVNDRFGHYAGDRLLCQVAEVLGRYAGARDVLARFGGDEFLMCCYGLETPEQLHGICNQILRDITTLPDPQQRFTGIGASIGGVFALEPGVGTLDDMAEQADYLMYRAKASQRRKIVIDMYYGPEPGIAAHTSLRTPLRNTAWVDSREDKDKPAVTDKSDDKCDRAASKTRPADAVKDVQAADESVILPDG